MSGLWKPFVIALAGFVLLDGIWLGVADEGFLPDRARAAGAHRARMAR